MGLPTEMPIGAVDAYARVTSIAANVLRAAREMKTAANGPVLVERVCDLFDVLRGAKDDGTRLAGVAGIEDHAKTILGADYSITASFGAVLVTGTAVTEWIIANVPGDGNGGIVVRRFVEGSRIQRATMSPEQIAPIVPLLDALIAAIEG